MPTSTKQSMSPILVATSLPRTGTRHLFQLLPRDNFCDSSQQGLTNRVAPNQKPQIQHIHTLPVIRGSATSILHLAHTPGILEYYADTFLSQVSLASRPPVRPAPSRLYYMLHYITYLYIPTLHACGGAWEKCVSYCVRTKQG